MLFWLSYRGFIVGGLLSGGFLLGGCWPRIVYILSCLSYSAVYLIRRRNCSIFMWHEFWIIFKIMLCNYLFVIILSCCNSIKKPQWCTKKFETVKLNWQKFETLLLNYQLLETLIFSSQTVLSTYIELGIVWNTNIKLPYLYLRNDSWFMLK